MWEGAERPSTSAAQRGGSSAANLSIRRGFGSAGLCGRLTTRSSLLCHLRSPLCASCRPTWCLHPLSLLRPALRRGPRARGAITSSSSSRSSPPQPGGDRRRQVWRRQVRRWTVLASLFPRCAQCVQLVNTDSFVHASSILLSCSPAGGALPGAGGHGPVVCAQQRQREPGGSGRGSGSQVQADVRL